MENQNPPCCENQCAACKCKVPLIIFGIIFSLGMFIAGIYLGKTYFSSEKNTGLVVPTPIASALTVPPTVGSAEQIKDDKAMVFIKNVYVKDGKNYIDVDIVNWMSGLEGSRACYEDGQCKETRCLTEVCMPNDYYLRNLNPTILTLEVPMTAVIEDLGNDNVGTNPNKISFVVFESNFKSPDPEKNWIQTSVYNIEVLEGNVVARIQQVYRP